MRPLILLPLLVAPLAAQDEIDFNRLRQLIEQSKGPQKQPTPEEQRVAQINSLQIDRSTAGILAARMLEAQQTETPEPAADAPPNPEEEVQRFGRDLVLSRWERVAAFLAALPEGSQAQAYQTILAKLRAPVAVNPPPELAAQGAQPHTQPVFLPADDFLQLAAAAPQPPAGEVIDSLAALLPADPRPPEEFFEALETGIKHFGGEEPADRLRAAELLIESGFLEEAAPFLPSPEEAREAKNPAALNLIARQRTEWFRKQPRVAGHEAIATAWEISDSLVSDAETPPPARAEALFRAVSLLPELDPEQGGSWLSETFDSGSGGGLEILATLGTITAQSRENPHADTRLSQLELQHDAARTLLTTEGIDPSAWHEVLTLYARQWQHEAELSHRRDQSSSRRMIPQYDNYGNIYYTSPSITYHGGGTAPIPAASLLECAPDEGWLARVTPAVRVECLGGLARLFLKVKEEGNALPLVGKLAETHPDLAVGLVRDTIQVWAENHNPNDEQDRRSQYFYYYGYNNPAGSIPLTRSKQERNLVELGELVGRIRELGLDESFHEELADAFISSHSRAEVWRVEAIEAVFGETSALDAVTVATLVERMRLNLSGLWPDPKLQQAYQTKRKDAELQAQILDGYESAIGLVRDALAAGPDDAWRLETQLAALQFEQSNYRSSLEPQNDHSTIVRSSLEGLAAAAGHYAATLPLADPDGETTAPFETWFFAALGSPSLEALKSHHLATPAEYPKIRAALESLPGETAERHLRSFAGTLNTRLANVSPDLKVRYLEGADAIIGDHETFRDAADVLAYYRDLVTEIELSARIDGPDTVPVDRPFGLQVNLRHTREIERESGGFQRYLQNQNASPYAYNFGRPPEDYRDKFEKTARAALEETFEVLSVTFHSEKVESRTDPEFGWRMTPYAYLLLQPKGPQIDRVPPLTIDLDFQDTSGYAVLPIASAEIPIATSPEAGPRPFRDLRLVQTLDTRNPSERDGIFLEIQATTHGLVPELASLVELPVEGFDVGEIEDRKLQLSELDAATDDLAPLSEREWRIELVPTGGALPTNFRFPEPGVELAAEDGLLRQRYDDVDLLPVGAEVPLGEVHRGPWAWILSGLVLLALVVFIVVRKRRRPPEVEAAPLHPLPSRLTPVTLLGWLGSLRDRPDLSAERRAALEQEIRELEAGHFSADAGAPASDALQAIAERWQRAA